MVKKSFGYLLVGCLFLCSCTRQETPLSVMTPQTDSVSREVTVYLLKSDLTRAMEVASASGFSNASVFARNFKQQYTMTPTEFRNKEN